MNLNHPAIDTGPLTAADLAAHNATKRCPPCHGDCWQGRTCPAVIAAEACTELGAEPLTPKNARIALALILLPWAVGVVAVLLAMA